MKKTIKGIFSPFTIICGCSILFFGLLAFLFPYTGDDWAWGSIMGIQRLDIFFDNYNGRYLGNFLVLAITRSKALKVVLMALSYFLSCWLCYKYSPNKKNATLLFAIFMFFLMPRPIFLQSVVWASGYANYVPSALLSVGYILIIRNITGQEAPKYPKFLFIATLVMGFCGAPFMENIALFNICLGVAVIGYCLIKFKKIYLTHFTFLLGAIGGAVWMFSNTAYRSVATGEDTYRTAATGMEKILEQAEINIKLICNNLVIENFVICIVVTILLSLLVADLCKKSQSTSKKYVAISMLVINIVFLFLVVCKKLKTASYYTCTYSFKFFDTLWFPIVATCTLGITALIIVLLCVRKHERFAILLPLYCIPVVVAPLLIVTPIGPRCFYISYLLTMVFAAGIFGYLTEDMERGSFRMKSLCGSLLIALLLQAIFYTAVFIPIYKYDTKRNEFAKIQSENQEETIVVCYLPNIGYVWCSSPAKEPWPTRYKLFHELENVPITVVSPEKMDEYYEEYMKEHKE